MKVFFKPFLFFIFIFCIFFSFTLNSKAIEKNPYVSKINPFSDNKTWIDFTTKKITLYSDDTISFKVNGKIIAEQEIDIYRSNTPKQQTIYLKKKLKAGTKIQVYLNYSEYTKETGYKITPQLIDTITVLDKTAPQIKSSDLTVRNTSYTIYTEKNAKVSATYNKKKIKVKKMTSTKWIAKIPKPLKGKKLLITSTDLAKNINKVTKTTVIPFNAIMVSSAISTNKQVTGLFWENKNTDKVTMKIGSKTYKGSIKKDTFKIKFGNIKTPKNVKIQLKDKFGNILASDTIRIYKYEKVKIGMTKSQVLNSKYGAPHSKSSDRYGKDYYEQWQYNYTNKLVFLSFYNGKLNNISKYDN